MTAWWQLYNGILPRPLYKVSGEKARWHFIHCIGDSEGVLVGNADRADATSRLSPTVAAIDAEIRAALASGRKL